MKKIYLVSYDLSSDGTPDYDGVGSALESCGVVNHFQRSVWLVSSEKSAQEIRDAVCPVLRPTDTVFVAAIIGAWSGWNTRLSAWINENRAS